MSLLQELAWSLLGQTLSPPFLLRMDEGTAGGEEEYFRIYCDDDHFRCCHPKMDTHPHHLHQANTLLVPVAPPTLSTLW